MFMFSIFPGNFLLSSDLPRSRSHMSGPETSLIFFLLSGNTNKEKRDFDWEYPTILEGLSLYTRGGGVTGSVYVCTNEVWWKCLFTSNVLEKTYDSNYLEGLNYVGQSSANGQGRGTADSYVAKQRNRSITASPTSSYKLHPTT